MPINVFLIYNVVSLSTDGMVIIVCACVFRYVVTLVVDGMRAVRGFHFDKAAASVLTTCVSRLGRQWCGKMAYN